MPNIGSELLDQSRLVIMITYSQNRSNLRTNFWEHRINRVIHHQFAIGHLVEQFETIALSMQRVDHNQMFLARVEHHTICATPIYGHLGDIPVKLKGSRRC